MLRIGRFGAANDQLASRKISMILGSQGRSRHNVRRAVSTRRVFAAGALLVVLMAASGCSDEQPQGETEEEGAAAAADAPLTEKRWLQVTGTASPELWLASRGAREQSSNESALADLRESLAAASRRFGESPRMIANRAVQLETMLAKAGAPEAAPSLIAALLSVVGESGQTEGFGAISQHYYNLRAASVDRESALADLKRRYGARK